tara:strand:+ start:498 stop:1340 length:843 start_codon:yes stop_codon:yes gene_type:complete
MTEEINNLSEIYNEKEHVPVQVSSGRPCLILLLLDQSGSMSMQFGNNSREKLVAQYANQIISEIGYKCIQDGEVKNRFEIAVIGYGLKGKVYSAFQGQLQNRWVVSIKELFEKPYGEENGSPIWITPKSGSTTPMTECFMNAKNLINDWINWGNHNECHPPIMLNITDGIPTDCDSNFKQLLNITSEIKNLHTNYGSTLIGNCHIGGNSTETNYPTQLQPNADAYDRAMFNISSKLTPAMAREAEGRGLEGISSESKLYLSGVENPEQIITFLQIGSSVA